MFAGKCGRGHAVQCVLYVQREVEDEYAFDEKPEHGADVNGVGLSCSWLDMLAKEYMHQMHVCGNGSHEHEQGTPISLSWSLIVSLWCACLK